MRGAEGAELRAPTCVVVDDHPLIAYSLRRVLEGNVRVVGEATDAAAGVVVALDLRPDVVLSDVRMPGRNAFDAAAEIVRETGAQTKVLFFTGDRRSAYLDRAIACGASGIASKSSESAGELTSILRHVAAGGEYFSRDWEQRRVDLAHGHAADPAGSLTPRQLAVLEAKTAGDSNKQIAAKLGVSQRAVAYDLADCKRVLGARTDFELALRAVAEGLVYEEFQKASR